MIHTSFYHECWNNWLVLLAADAASLFHILLLLFFCVPFDFYHLHIPLLLLVFVLLLLIFYFLLIFITNHHHNHRRNHHSYTSIYLPLSILTFCWNSLVKMLHIVSFYVLPCRCFGPVFPFGCTVVDL